jgi:hypothetical protein
MGAALTDIMVMHTQAPRPDPRGLLPEISEGSAKLVMRMMAIRPEERPQSAIELALEIEELLPSLPEPEELVRPAQRVQSSGQDAVPSEAGGSRPAAALTRQEKLKPPRPSLLTRLVGWFSEVIGGG